MEIEQKKNLLIFLKVFKANSKAVLAHSLYT